MLPLCAFQNRCLETGIGGAARGLFGTEQKFQEQVNWDPGRTRDSHQRTAMGATWAAPVWNGRAETAGTRQCSTWSGRMGLKP